MIDYDFNDIHELLRSGVSSSEIAEAFTHTLNKEIADYEEELRAVPDTYSPENFADLTFHTDFSEFKTEDYYKMLTFAWNSIITGTGPNLYALILDNHTVMEIVETFLHSYQSLSTYYKHITAKMLTSNNSQKANTTKSSPCDETFLSALESFIKNL